MAESEVRADLGHRPGPSAAAAGPSSLALRAQLTGHEEDPTDVEQVARQKSEWRAIPAAVQVALANETEFEWRRRRR